ncbi:MAG: carboxypeptidase-like regulatory domain-containing protein [Bacteroidales bacterium]
MKTNLIKSITLGLLAVVGLMTAGFAQTGAQSFHSIHGVVKDAKTQKPIAFASVFVPGTSIGTVANLDGVFTLKVDKSLDAERFSISHLGYRMSQFVIEESLGEDRVFLLEAFSVLLQEVVIQPNDARALVEQAIDKVFVNYPEEPLKLTGFYREAIKQRRDYISISEAVVDVYQVPYKHQYQSDRMKIVQGRKSGDVKKADTLIVKLQGGPHVSMLLDIVKNPDVLLSRETLKYYEYELLDMVRIDNETNYVIGFEPRAKLPFPLYQGKLYISTETLAITMAEFSLDLSDKDKAAQNFIMKKPARMRFTPTNTNYLVTYKEIDGKYHINYVRSELEFFADGRRRIFRTPYSIMAEMAITNRDSKDVNRMAHRESFRPNTILADQVPVYFDQEFWGNYNVIEPEESIESAIQKLNKRLEN